MNEKDNNSSEPKPPTFRFTYGSTLRILRHLARLKTERLTDWFELSDIPYKPPSSRYEMRAWLTYLGLVRSVNGRMRLTTSALEFLSMNSQGRSEYLQKILKADGEFRTLWADICRNRQGTDEIEKERAKSVFHNHYPTISGSTLDNRFGAFANISHHAQLWERLPKRHGKRAFRLHYFAESEPHLVETQPSFQKSLERMGLLLYHLRDGHHRDIDSILYELGVLRANDGIGEESYVILVGILKQMQDSDNPSLHKILSEWHFWKSSQTTQKPPEK